MFNCCLATPLLCPSPPAGIVAPYHPLLSGQSQLNSKSGLVGIWELLIWNGAETIEGYSARDVTEDNHRGAHQ